MSPHDNIFSTDNIRSNHDKYQVWFEKAIQQLNAYSNFLQKFDVPWDLALGLGGPMGFGGLCDRPVWMVGWSGGRVWTRWVPTNRQLGAAGSQTSMGVPEKTFWWPVSMCDPSKRCEMSKSQTQSIRLNFLPWILAWWCTRELGLGENQAILGLTPKQVIFEIKVTISGKQLLVLTDELWRVQDTIKKEVLWIFVR